MLENITFQQIEAFITIAKYNSISKACDALFISQPALSKILKRFEDNVGTSLFTRSNQGVALTTVGKYLYLKLTPLYNELDDTFQSLGLIMGPEDRTLHIVLPAIFDYCDAFAPVKERIQRFKALRPDVRVTETVLELERLQHTLNIGLADIVIAPDYSLDFLNSDKFKVKTVSEIRQYITMSTSSPLASQDNLDYSALENEYFLCVPFNDSKSSKDILLHLCQQNGFRPSMVGYPPNYQTLIHSISIGRAMSITWQFRSDYENPEFKCFPLQNVDRPLHVVMAWDPSRLSRAASEFLAL